MEYLPEILGQKKEKDSRDEEWKERQKNLKLKIEDNEELINQAKELGLKTPSKF